MLNDDRLDHLVESKMINFNKLPKFFSEMIKEQKFFCKVVSYGDK